MHCKSLWIKASAKCINVNKYIQMLKCIKTANMSHSLLKCINISPNICMCLVFYAYKTIMLATCKYIAFI